MIEDFNGKKSKIFSLIMKIFSGFLFGVGFSIAMVVVFASVELSGFFDEDGKETKKEEIEVPSFETYMSSRIEFDEKSGLAIINHEFKKYENKLIILGQIKNSGQETWERIHIQVELFDTDNKFVDQCSDLIWGAIRADQIRNFKVTCGECENVPLVDFSTYEIKILDASHKEIKGT